MPINLNLTTLNPSAFIPTKEQIEWCRQEHYVFQHNQIILTFIFPLIALVLISLSRITHYMPVSPLFTESEKIFWESFFINIALLFLFGWASYLFYQINFGTLQKVFTTING